MIADRTYLAAPPDIPGRQHTKRHRNAQGRREETHEHEARALYLGVAAIALALIASPAPLCAQQAASAVSIDADDIGGVVTGANGPEAGVWVIAETTDLPTRYTKSVVTDDQGRYVIPDLPIANYQVWVRGYGLVDSPKMRAKPGQHPQPHRREGARRALGRALLSGDLLVHDDEDPAGGGLRRAHRHSEEHHARDLAAADEQCRLRRLPSARPGSRRARSRRSSASSTPARDAWIRRIAAGQSGEMMTNRLAGQLGGVPYKYFGDWTDRVAKGELPKHKPQRPSGVERNLVVTTWDWSTPDKYLHDLISSDRRKPTVNAGGPLYGAPEYSTDLMPILDPKTHKVSYFKMPVADPNMPVSLGPGHAGAIKPTTPSAYWGDTVLWDTKANQHNAMFDDKGRVWLAATVRGMDNPAWCKKGSEHPSAKVFPIDRSPRQVAMLDPKTQKYSFIDTCFGTHHPQFGYDADNTLWLSGSGPVAGWINTKVWDETGDAQKAVGWFPFVLDSNGNGKLDEFAEPGKSEEGKDMRFNPGSGPYAVMPHPTDGSVWYTVRHVRRHAGLPALRSEDQAERVLRAAEGSRRRARRRHRRGRRAVGLGLRRSSDRVRPAQVQGAAQRPERDRQSLSGRLHAAQVSGAGLRRRCANRSAEASYYTWVDHHNAVGLGDEHSDLDRKPAGRLRRLQGRQDDPDARAVPDGLLRQGSRRAHRRSERRLEGPRPVERERRPHAVAQRARQGRASDGGAHPGAARSAGEVGEEQEQVTPGRTNAAPAHIPLGLATAGGRHDIQAGSFRERGGDRHRGGFIRRSAQQVTVDSDNIGGVVTGPNGPEAGVWVIAETTDLPTRFIKSVVTDDQGRYLIPELPKANYEVFARGYGLTDSAQGRRASRARSSTSPPRRRRRRRRPKSIRRSTGIRC